MIRIPTYLMHKLIALLLITITSLIGSEKPNIILILADDLGYGDLSCYGSPSIHTPNLDLLAKEGQRWTDFYSASPICTPSRSALLTGLYPFRTGTDTEVFYEWSAGGLPKTSHTIAELLKSFDYHTICIGKWHLGHSEGFLPQDHGFDDFYGIPYSNDMRVDPKMKVSDTVHFREGMTLKKMRTPGNKVKNWVPLYEMNEIIEYPCDQQLLTSRYTDRSIEFIHRYKDRPFFLFLSHSMPHIPVATSEKFTGKSEHGPYGDAVEEIDESLGRIVNTLKILGIEKNTLIIFTSDNGPDLTYNDNPGSAGPFKGSKFYPSEGGQRVPAIFWWPSRIQPSVSNEIGSTLDIYNTIKNLLPESKDTQPPSPQDSYDLSRALLHNQPSNRDNFFYLSTALPPRAQVYALRKNQWKAHFYISKPPFYDRNQLKKLDPIELYNIQENPAEDTNLAHKHPDIIKDILKLKTEFEKSVKLAKDQSIEKLEYQTRPDWAR